MKRYYVSLSLATLDLAALLHQPRQPKVTLLLSFLRIVFDVWRSIVVFLLARLLFWLFFEVNHLTLLLRFTQLYLSLRLLLGQLALVALLLPQILLIFIVFFHAETVLSFGLLVRLGSGKSTLSLLLRFGLAE